MRPEYVKIITNAKYRVLVKFTLDLLSILLSVYGAYFLKYEFHMNEYLKNEYVAIYTCSFIFFYVWKSLENKSWRYINTFDILEYLKAAVLIIISSDLVIYLAYKKRIPLTIVFMIFLIFVSLQMAGRFIFRLRRFKTIVKSAGKKGKNILIYGAGEAGVVLAKEFLTNSAFPYNIVGFIDDDKNKIGTEIYGIKVLGGRRSLTEILFKYRIDEIFLVMPSIKGSEIQRILEKLKLYRRDNLSIKIIPGISELVADKSMVSQLREVKIEDLLGREEVVINDEAVKDLVENKVVFVTGGAGSIGSELSRQIAKYNPSKLIIVDINENDSYFLELELKRKHQNLDVTIEICNIREREKLEFLFNKYNPNLVFHAAAHKHVPLMEHNPEEAIKNNIFGTKNVAECADKYGVEKMVLISTDKAVNPTNLMGASKRACELVIEHMNKISKNTKFMAVRFGNVLGSNGSVIPIFKKLIEQGKNLTLTHRDVTRYFMTIPEAAQLVIEAGAIGNGGEIFILDMGKPIKIYNLAKTMIRLSNANVGIDIVGLRPGEKLFEELLYDVNAATKTENKKIFIAKIESGDTDITKFYEKLEACIKNPDTDNIKRIMKEIVSSYKEINYNN